MAALPTDPAEIEANAVRAAVQKRVSEGRLPLDVLTQNAMTPKDWTLDWYAKALRNLAPTSAPVAPGKADLSEDWRERLKDDLRAAEGFREEAYDDAAKGAEAPTVGYGFNLASPVSRAAMKTALNLSDAEVAAIASKKRKLSRGESERVLDHIITALDAELQQALPGVSLNDPQRRALLNLSYNSGLPALRAVGVLDAVKAGDTAGVVKALLGWAPPKDKASGKPLAHVAQRRKLAALTYVGGDIDDFKDFFK